jgi:hypothetical protein
MAPHTLMQMSLTINTPYPSTCSLSPPVSKLHSSVTDTTTSSCFTQVAHVPCHHLSCHNTTCLLLSGDACATSPLFAHTFAYDTPAHNPSQSHADVHPKICNIRSPMFTHTQLTFVCGFVNPTRRTTAHSRSFLLFTHPFCHLRAGLRTSVRAHQAWARIQPNTSHFCSFKIFSLCFCSPVHSVICDHLQSFLPIPVS